MQKINVYLYKSPKVNKKVAEGILEGIDEFLKSKVKARANYKIGNWKKIKKEKEDFLNVFFTKNSLTRSKMTKGKHLEGNLIFRTGILNDLRNYKDDKSNMDYLKKMRGKLAGYSELARLLNLDCCNEGHCAFNFEKDELDTLAFLLHLNKEIPLCRYHKGWRFEN